MKRLSKGAEADLFLEDGNILKRRVEKKYRIPVLDKRIRRRRTKSEAKNLERAKSSGVNVPAVVSVDEKGYAIRMQYLKGDTLKDVIEGGSDLSYVVEVGGILKKLHEANLVHNDLTTSNIIVSEDKPYFIDFGLSFQSHRLEDKAMDLVVFKKSIEATHPQNAKMIWDKLLSGYCPSAQILSRVKTIEKRVRYK